MAVFTVNSGLQALSFNPSDNRIGGKWRLTVIFLRRTEEGGGTEEDSSDQMRMADDLDLPRVWNKYGAAILKLLEGAEVVGGSQYSTDLIWFLRCMFKLNKTSFLLNTTEISGFYGASLQLSESLSGSCPSSVMYNCQPSSESVSSRIYKVC